MAAPKQTSVAEEIERYGTGRFQYLALVLCGSCNAVTAVGLLYGSYVLPLLNLHTAEKGTMTSAVFVGMLVGGLVSGSLSDYIGRKPCLVSSLLITTVCGAAVSIMPTWWAISVCNCASGLGIGGIIPVAFTLYNELLPTKDRGFWLTLIAWFWMFGAIFIAGLAWAMLEAYNIEWRVFVAVCSIPGAITTAACALLLPESPRWLEQTNRTDEALHVLQRISKMNQPEAPLLTEGMCAVTLAQQSLNNAERDSEACTTALKVLVSPSLRVRTIALAFIWFMLSLGWYGINLWIPQLFKSVQFNLNIYQDAFFVAAASLPGNFLSTILIDRIGRRLMLFVCTLLAGLMCVGLALTHTQVMMVTLACALNAISNGAWNSLDCLSTEGFPTSVRSSAYGVLAAAGRIGSVAGQYSAAAGVNSPAHTFAIAAAVLFAAAIASTALPSDATLKEQSDETQCTTDNETRKPLLPSKPKAEL